MRPPSMPHLLFIRRVHRHPPPKPLKEPARIVRPKPPPPPPPPNPPHHLARVHRRQHVFIAHAPHHAAPRRRQSRHRPHHPLSRRRLQVNQQPLDHEQRRPR